MFKILTALGRGFTGLGTSIKVGLVALVIILLMAGAFKLYYEKVQHDKAQLQQQLDEKAAEATREKLRADSAEESNKTLQKNFQEQTKKIDELDKKRGDIRTKRAKTSKTIARHDLEALSNAKPTLIEQRMNDATARALRELEEITQPESYDAWRTQQ